MKHVRIVPDSARVDRVPDPRKPGKEAVRIVAPSFEAAQRAVNDLMCEPDVGSAVFSLPKFDGLVWLVAGQMERA